MWNFKKDTLIQVLSVLALFLINALFLSGVRQPKESIPIQSFVPRYTPTPTPFIPFPYKIPEVAYATSYKLMLVGDSIVASLGPNAPLVRQHLIEHYPEHEFVNYNYGFGGTSIETLPERLEKSTEYLGQTYQSILSLDFDLIIIESFAYNPLSQEAAEEGVNKHLRILDESIKRIIQNKPNSVVAILTPIAPSKTRFAEGVYDLSPSERVSWAEERISYIEAVINYARENEIPLINVYERSLTPGGNGDLKYINPDDYIHPSHTGVDLISKEIADFVFKNKILPE